VLVLGVAGGLSAQSTISRHTEIFNFLSGIKLGGGTTITGASGTGTAAVVLPVNSVGLGTEVSGFAEPVTFCGQLVDGSVSAATVYLGPSTAQLNGTPTDLVAGGTVCDTLDSTTEATADAPLSTLAVKIVGMRCKQSTASGAGKTTTYTLRSAEADAVTTDGGATALSCAIAGATATECRVLGGSTSNIAAGATVAVKALTDANLSAGDGWCRVLVAWP
jgi:hypothetical protein